MPRIGRKVSIVNKPEKREIVPLFFVSKKRLGGLLEGEGGAITLSDTRVFKARGTTL